MNQTIDFRLIRQLWMFLAVAEEQHFGRAAQRLNMSQPPLTEQIKVLEQSLKLQLFNRSRQGTQLSAAGAAILPAVRQFAGQVEQLERVVREVAAGQTGVLNVGAITSAMLETVPPILDALKRAHPHLSVFVKEIDSVDAVPQLEAGELDLAFVRVDGEVGGIIATLPLAEDRLAVARGARSCARRAAAGAATVAGRGATGDVGAPGQPGLFRHADCRMPLARPHTTRHARSTLGHLADRLCRLRAGRGAGAGVDAPASAGECRRASAQGEDHGADGRITLES